jgi:membrane protease YdiL (CAAX protease family)
MSFENFTAPTVPPQQPLAQDPEFASRPTPTKVPHHQYISQTLREAMILMFINLVLSLILLQAKATFFMPSAQNSGGIQQLGLNNPLKLLLLGVIAAPILEELLFRGVPYGLLQLVKRWAQLSATALRAIYLTLGGSFAVVFAMAHGLGSSELHLPLPQLVVGIWSWHVINTRGLRYSILLHAIYNGIPLVLLTLSQALRS